MQYGRDGANRSAQVTGNDPSSAAKTYVASVQYASHGDWASYRYGNGLGRTYAYNARLQPQQMTDTQSGQSKPLLDLQQRWGDANTQTTNNNGDLRSLAINTNNGPNLATANNFLQGMSYDGIDRLKGWTDGNGLNRTFDYDRFGNLAVTSNSGVPLNGLTPTATAQYNSKNQLVSGGATYDYGGNQSKFSTYQLTYDGENRQTSITDSFSGLYVQYGYDADGHRVFKQLSTRQTIYYAYDAFGQMAAEYSAQRAGQSFCGTCYLSWDHLGSTRLITDQNDNLVTRYDYLPFGETIDSGVGGRTNVWNAYDAVEQKFTGQRRDTESGLDFFEARYLSNVQHRFLSPDPKNVGADPTTPQSWNGYVYVNNNPLNSIDPDGTTCVNSLGAFVPDNPNDGAVADNQDGYGCLAAGVRPGAPEDPGVLNQGQINARVTDVELLIETQLAGYSVSGLSFTNSNSNASTASTPSNEQLGVPNTSNIAVVYRQQAMLYVRASGIGLICPKSGPEGVLLNGMRLAITSGAIAGAIRGSRVGFVAGSAMDGIGAVPGAALGAALGATRSVVTSTLRIRACEAMAAPGY